MEKNAPSNFGSKMIDANLQQDSTNTDGDITVSSFQASGLHSSRWLEDKDIIQKQKQKGIHINIETWG